MLSYHDNSDFATLSWLIFHYLSFQLKSPIWQYLTLRPLPVVIPGNREEMWEVEGGGRIAQ